MAQSTDPGHFFQTTSALDESARRLVKSKNSLGDPIRLPSKLLAVAADPRSNEHIYVAEAAGNVKRINLKTSDVSTTYSGPTAPLTCVAVSVQSAQVFAGCWDKSIWSWSVTTRRPGRRFRGHSDFVKAIILVHVGGRELLISGSSDATIVVWCVETGQMLHTLKGHTRGVLSLAVDPAEYESSRDTITVFSAGSDREIRQWSIGLSSALEVHSTGKPTWPLIVHETSIDSMYFDSDGDLWTASADKSARCLSRGRGWEEDMSLEHPDFVRDIVVDETGGWVVTACRDEEVRVWEKGSGRLHHTLSGHFEEVTGLLLLPGQELVSVSIDGTVRKWSLKAQDLAKAIKEVGEKRIGITEEKEPKEGVLTEEEERELAELMEDDE